MKIKVLVISVLLLVALLLAQFLLLPTWYRESGIRLSGWLMMLSVAAALAINAVLLKLMIMKFADRGRRGGRIGAYIGGFGMLPIASFVGFVVGGTFGGAEGDRLIGDTGVILGIGLGVFVITLIICLVSAVLGFAIGELMQKVLRWK